ncbi:hypothetical protein ANO11243_081890 [Dothideomycetidae sp. 11243]|nr:hypothetical protein ANO11243_081890 [fungal sp. No.11243]
MAEDIHGSYGEDEPWNLMHHDHRNRHRKKHRKEPLSRLMRKLFKRKKKPHLEDPWMGPNSDDPSFSYPDDPVIKTKDDWAKGKFTLWLYGKRPHVEHHKGGKCSFKTKKCHYPDGAIEGCRNSVCECDGNPCYTAWQGWATCHFNNNPKKWPVCGK